MVKGTLGNRVLALPVPGTEVKPKKKSMDVRISAGNAKRTREQLEKMKEEKVVNRLKKALIV